MTHFRPAPDPEAHSDFILESSADSCFEFPRAELCLDLHFAADIGAHTKRPVKVVSDTLEQVTHAAPEPIIA